MRDRASWDMEVTKPHCYSNELISPLGAVSVATSRVPAKEDSQMCLAPGRGSPAVCPCFSGLLLAPDSRPESDSGSVLAHGRDLRPERAWTLGMFEQRSRCDCPPPEGGQSMWPLSCGPGQPPPFGGGF